MVLIDALYINNSGGKVLLEFLIDSLVSRHLQGDFFFLLDNRLVTDRFDMLADTQVRIIGPSERQRLQFYKNLPYNFVSILCFANVPPPVKLSSTNIHIFFHNSLLLNANNTNYGLKSSILFFFKRWYIRSKNTLDYDWIVQTERMKRSVVKNLNIAEDKVNILPFFKSDNFLRINLQLKSNQHRFLYVADGVEQKNHRRLLEAWKIINTLVDSKLELHLTIANQFTDLLDMVEKFQEHGCSIINHGVCPQAELVNLYSSCNYFIFPSLTESFGLPLIEAATAGCEIISSDLPYVFEVVKPSMTFDPYNTSSIVEAVKWVVENQMERGTECRVVNQINDFIDLIRK